MTIGAHLDVEAFFRRWAISFDEMCDAYRTALGEGGEWVAGPPPIPTTYGGEAAVGLLEGFRDGYDLTTIDVDLLSFGGSGGVVYSERVDHLVDSTGSRFLSLPVAGVMRFDGGYLSHWRDYWDMRDFLALPRR
ncbi:limonene-1,2-epoxide hydrolase family protein [Mycolicibacterium sp.]|uniref:limonene-1,2-epoxide hydrolase family protein n=1 Tax=Mycolicibacterium sp. TaxID=2320850 RepID=UPI001A27521F|nr:limonene-1,2-epoxide hydrolase family protein [Mycolicibacterium sp.]MBJ7337562.1 limonene-1,2-epoxide hydrolase [Mycolicibacterium sp.]